MGCQMMTTIYRGFAQNALLRERNFVPVSERRLKDRNKEKINCNYQALTR